PGSRLVPEAPSSSNVVGASAGAAGAAGSGVVGALPPSSGVAALTVSAATTARTGTIEVALASGVRDSVPPALGGTAAIEPVPAAAARGATPAAMVPALPPNAGRAATVLPAAATSSAAVPVDMDRDPTSAAVPGVRPVCGAMQSGDVATLEDDSEDEPAAIPAADLADALLWQRAADTCFTERSWAAELAQEAAPAGVVLAVALGGGWGDRATETESRKRQRFLIPSI